MTWVDTRAATASPTGPPRSRSTVAEASITTSSMPGRGLVADGIQGPYGALVRRRVGGRRAKGAKPLVGRLRCKRGPDRTLGERRHVEATAPRFVGQFIRNVDVDPGHVHSIHT